MNKRIGTRFWVILILCVANLGLLVTVGKLRQKVEARTSALTRLEYTLLTRGLHVPYEAIFYDLATMQKISKIRAEAYESLQVGNTILYKDVNLFNLSPFGNAGARFESVDDWSTVLTSSFENMWFNHIGNACHHVVDEVTYNERLRLYLAEHPQEADALVELLERIGKSPNTRLSGAATAAIRDLQGLLER